MHSGTRPLIAAICVMGGAILAHAQQPARSPQGLAVGGDCGTPVVVHGTVARTSLGTCIPPYETPPYTRPADDSVALGSLLEAAGYYGIAGAQWVGVTAGHFCEGWQQQLLVVRNQPVNFSLLGGPTPHLVGGGDFPGIASGSWRGLGTGHFDDWPYDEFIAVRQLAEPGYPDLVVGRFYGNCGGIAPVASATLGNPANSEWVGAAVGNFDGTGKKRIALLKQKHSNLFVMEFNQGVLNVVDTEDFDTDPSHPSEWKGLAAGDLDGDGIDELVAVRRVSDNQNPTVIAFKWNGSKFVPFASSTFGNNGNSEWGSVTLGDFNGDGRKAIVVAKNKHSNFAVFDFPGGGSQLRVLATADLDSVAGQDWTGLSATDWLPGDQGAAELIAVRAVSGRYRTNVFVYGNPFHRIPRDTGLDGTRAQWGNTTALDDLKNWLRGSHTNTMYWLLNGPGDYTALVKFLHYTKNWGVDGKQLRVVVTLVPPKAVTSPGSSCSQPENTSPDLTSWDAQQFFKGDGDTIARCRDMLAWASLIGRLAQDFPHLVGLAVDDFSDDINQPFTPDFVADMESNMRAQSPWLNFVPYVYHPHPTNGSDEWTDHWADMGPALDSMVFFFRNDKRDPKGRHCLDNSVQCERTADNAPDEIADMSSALASGRKLLLGIYFVGLWSGSNGTPPLSRYDYDLARLAFNLPTVAGAVAYGVEVPNWSCTGADDPKNCAACTGAQCVANCTEANFLASNYPGDPAKLPFNLLGADRYCALQKAYDGKSQIVTDHELAPNAPATAGRPAAYFGPTDGTHHVIYRSSNGHLHELWWVSQGPVSHRDLTPHGPIAVNDPSPYFNPADGRQHVIYRSGDGHLHELWWVGQGAIGQGDLIPHGPLAVGDPAPYAANGIQHVVYRSGDNHLHELWWSTGPVGQGDLTPHGPLAESDPAAYFSTTDATNHVVYRSEDNHLHELWWSAGPVGQGDLTPNPPFAIGDVSTYFNTSDNSNHVVYSSPDKYVHELHWVSGSVSHIDLSSPYVSPPASHPWTSSAPALPAVDNPSGYFVAEDGNYHVIYRSEDGHLNELRWTNGIVSRNDLTALAAAPPAVGDVSAYYAASEGTHHVIYRSSDGHLRELRWKN